MESFQQAAAVCFVIGLALLMAYVARRAKTGWTGFTAFRGPGGATKRMRMVERLVVSPQHWVCIVRVDDYEMVLGVAPGSVSVLSSAKGEVA